MLVHYDSAAVDRMEIRSSSGTVTLAREAAKWMLTSPIHYRADDNMVATAIGKGNHIELKNLVSSNPQKQQLFQLDSTGTLAVIFSGGKEAAAFRIGKTSPSYTETYVRRENSDDVYLADGAFGYTFTRPVKDWRDKTIFKAEESAITSVAFRYGDTTFTLTRADSLWQVDGDSAVEPTVRSFLTALSNLQADDFIDSTLADLPPVTCELAVAGVTIRWHWNKDGNKYYVMTSQSPQLFEVQGWRAGQVLKKKKDFLPHA
jgi:hypothetical protein